VAPVKSVTKTASGSNKALTYAEIEPLLVKNTCTACHQTNKRQVGPSFADIAKRKYSNERIVELIYKPEPKNWPEHETPMAAMPQVPRAEALKIASWINSLRAPAP
jgi:cytochrome c551/c552